MREYNNIQSNSTYSEKNFSKDDIIKYNENYCQKFDLKLTDKEYSLPIMNWFPKLHKTPIGAIAIIASKNCSVKPLSGVTSKNFKMLLKHAGNFQNKNTFYSSYKRSWGCAEFLSNYWKIKYH